MKIVFSVLFLFLINTGQAQLENLKTDFTEYKIPSSDCVGIQHESGSRIFIPENAFNLDGLNKPDSLDLLYKEYFEPIDFLTNGLDLHFEESFMVSGGMFELFVKFNDEIILLNSNKEIRVEFIKKNDIPVFDEFAYDEKTKSWDRNTNFSDEEILNDWNDNNVNESIDTIWQINPIFLEEEMVIVNSISFQESPLFQTMNISSYGLFNYDYILKDETAVPLLANFNIKGFDIKPSLIYLVYEDLNTLIYYTDKDFKENFRILSDKEFKIFTFDKENQVASWEKPRYFKLEDLRDKEFTFQLEIDKNGFQTKNELKEQIGI